MLLPTLLVWTFVVVTIEFLCILLVLAKTRPTDGTRQRLPIAIDYYRLLVQRCGENKKSVSSESPTVLPTRQVLSSDPGSISNGQAHDGPDPSFLGLGPNWYQGLLCTNPVHRRIGAPLYERIHSPIARFDEKTGSEDRSKRICLLSRGGCRLPASPGLGRDAAERIK